MWIAVGCVAAIVVVIFVFILLGMKPGDVP
jgi:hypothetical protein